MKAYQGEPGMRLPDEVHIRMVENGFIVSVGCKTFVTNSWHELCVELGAYFADPKKASAEYNKNKVTRFN